MPIRGRIKFERFRVTDGSATPTVIAEVDIYLNKESMTFSAMEGESHWTNRDGAKLKQEIEDHFRKVVALDWRPCITFWSGRRPRRGDVYEDRAEGIEVHVGRFYWAESADGLLHQVDWDTPPSLRLSKSRRLRRAYRPNPIPFRPPCADERGPDGETVQYRPYDDELWAALTRLLDATAAIRGRVEELMGTDAGERALRAGAALAALPEPDAGRALVTA